jgi:hypothetical protein
LIAAVAATIAAAPAFAAVDTATTVTSLVTTSAPPTNDGTTFTAPTGELRPQPNPTSSATITSSTALDADGSLQLSGLRTRVYNDLSGANIAAGDLVSLGGDYLVNNGSSDGIQSPAFRVYVRGSDGLLNELIWEASNNNGGYTLGQADSLQSGDNFWRQIVGQGFDGTGGIGQGGYVNRTLEAWGDLLGGSVLGVGVGNGGCPGNCTNFNALADNIALTTTSGSRSYNFAASSVAAVPEPATWAMMLIGFGGMGVSMRRNRRRSAANIPQMA